MHQPAAAPDPHQPPRLTPDAVARLNAEFEALPPADLPARMLAWAATEFAPRVALTSSFQTQSVALLHILGQSGLPIPVIFLDTGYHFPETLAYRDQLAAAFGLTLRIVRPEPDGHTPGAVPLYRSDPDACCYRNKVLPMQRALADLDAWLSGIRRDQTPQRASAQPVEALPDGRLKLHPLLTWTRADLWRYIHQHDLPAHPLFSQGYLSVGCAPCTSPVSASDGDERAGRWAGSGKTECGLHTHPTDTRVGRPGDAAP